MQGTRDRLGLLDEPWSQEAVVQRALLIPSLVSLFVYFLHF
jgi:hypothetical protein